MNRYEFKCNSQDYFLLETYYNEKSRKYMTEFIIESLNFCYENLSHKDIFDLLCKEEISWKPVKAEVNKICFFYDENKFNILKGRFEEIFMCDIYSTAVIRYSLILYCKNIQRNNNNSVKSILNKEVGNYVI